MPSPALASRAITRRALCLTLLALVAVPGCWARTAPRADDPLGPITIKVISHNTADVTIYAVRSGQRIRIGQANGLSTTTFEVLLRDISSTGEFQILCDPIGSSQTFTTERIHVWTGQTVELMLESPLYRSSLSIFDS